PSKMLTEPSAKSLRLPARIIPGTTALMVVSIEHLPLATVQVDRRKSDRSTTVHEAPAQSSNVQPKMSRLRFSVSPSHASFSPLSFTLRPTSPTRIDNLPLPLPLGPKLHGSGSVTGAQAGKTFDVDEPGAMHFA